MKAKVVYLVFILALCSGSLFAQNPTAVTGTLTDPSSIAYYPATVSACLTPNTIDPTVGGKHVNPNIGSNYCVGPVPTASNGAFSMSLFANANISPAATQWIFTVQTSAPGPPVGNGPLTFSSAAVTISGTSQDVSTSINSVGTAQLRSSSGSSSPGVFNFLNYGAIDDDVTDNCANGAVAAFTAAVNAYSGPGVPSAFITPGVSNKAFKLATNSNACSFIFTLPVTLHFWATIDCAQTANNCMQTCASNLSSLSNENAKYHIYGGGTFIGGANLVKAGIEVEPFCDNVLIDGLNFTNFGATNATAGSCTNWAILVDDHAAETSILKNHWVESDSTPRRCGFKNSSTAGTNTVFFDHNTLGGQNLAGTTCGSVGIEDGGSYGFANGNNIFAFGIPVRLSGQGSRATGNNIDSSNCSASGVNAAFQFGAAGSGTQVGHFSLFGNEIQAGTGHTSFLFAQAGDSTATVAGVSLIGNVSDCVACGSNVSIMPSTVNCSPNTSTGTTCYEYANADFIAAVPCGTTNIGWQFGNILAACSDSAKVANITPTTLFTPGITQGTDISCTITLTVAATTSSTLPSCSITLTDVFSNVSQTYLVTPSWTNATAGCTNAGGASNTLGNACTGTITGLAPKLAVAVSYTTAAYASSGATAMQYTTLVRATTK